MLARSNGMYTLYAMCLLNAQNDNSLKNSLRTKTSTILVDFGGVKTNLHAPRHRRHLAAELSPVVGGWRLGRGRRHVTRRRMHHVGGRRPNVRGPLFLYDGHVVAVWWAVWTHGDIVRVVAKVRVRSLRLRILSVLPGLFRTVLWLDFKDKNKLKKNIFGWKFKLKKNVMNHLNRCFMSNKRAFATFYWNSYRT